MSKITYKNCPVREAIIDLSINKIDTQHIISSKDSLAEEFPNVKDFSENSVTFNLDAGEVDKTERIKGVHISTECDKYQGVILDDKIGLSRLKPYQGSDDLISKVKTCVDIIQVHSPITFNKIGARTINEFNLPLDAITNIEKYFKQCKYFSIDGHNDLNEYFESLMRNVFKIDNETQCIIHTVLTPNEEGLGVILDLDLIRNLNGVSFDKVEVEYRSIRDIRRSIFEEVLTDETKNKFK